MVSPISNKKEKIPVSLKEQKKIPRKRRRVALFRSEKKNTVEEEEKKPIPVCEQLSYSDFNIDSGTESEEEVLRDGEREEIDKGYKYVLSESTKTYTRVKTPVKVYHRHGGCSVLHCKSYPVPTVTKLALHRYNTIEGTDYEYVGLVKAYRNAADGSHYYVRFKARLPSKLPIYFQAMIWQRIPNRETNEVLVDVAYVYPLPSTQLIVRS